MPPTKTHDVDFQSILGSSTIELVDWKNPFSSDIEVNISLSKNTPISFKILLPSNKSFHLEKCSSLQVPIEFVASSLIPCEGELQISGLFENSQQLTWRYKLIGKPEIESQSGRFKIKCKSKSEINKTIHTRLEGIGEVTDDDIFTNEIISREEDK